MLKYSLGCNIDINRKVEKEYSVSATPLPPFILTDISHLPVLNQGQEPACVGHAGANGVNFDYYKKLNVLPLSSARWNYGVAKLIDGNVNEGTSATAMFNGWKKYNGSATVNTIPNDVTLPVIPYTQITITPVELADALKYPITSEVDIPSPSCLQLQSLIAQYGVVLIALTVDEDSWMTQDGHVTLKPGTAGGHEVLCFGYDTRNLNGDVRFFILNSWDKTWGNNGTGTFLWSDYQNNVYDAMSITVNTMPTVTLQRLQDDGVETVGKLTTGTFTCNTLERPNKGNLPNVSCVPTGTYTCQWEYMGDLKEYHYELQGVHGRSGIFIHEGNYVTDSEGCILLGNSYGDINKDGQPDVLNSKVTLAQFEALFPNHENFTLIIS